MTTQEHISHEREFRGDEVIAKRAKVNIVVCGCGALGSRLLYLLASQGYSLLTGIDFDKVERGNLATQNFDPTDIGKKKAVQTFNKIFRALGIKMTVVDKKLTNINAEKILRDTDLVVDVFDNVPSRKLVRDVCNKLGIECVHSGMGSMGLSQIEWNETYNPRVGKGEEDAEDGPCEYPLATNLVIATVALTAEVINQFVDNGEKRKVEFWLSQFSLESNT